MNTIEVPEFTLEGVQQLMRQLYLERDKERGIIKSLLWLSAEVGELANEVLKKHLNSDGSITNESMENIRLEFADVLAWLASCANILDVDLNQAFYEKYPNKCPKCLSVPCNCVMK